MAVVLPTWEVIEELKILNWAVLYIAKEKIVHHIYVTSFQIVKNILIPCHGKRKLLLLFFSLQFRQVTIFFFSLTFLATQLSSFFFFFPSPLWQLHCLNSFFLSLLSFTILATPLPQFLFFLSLFFEHFSNLGSLDFGQEFR